jgi:methylthioribose-1-phosphate isomerase
VTTTRPSRRFLAALLTAIYALASWAADADPLAISDRLGAVPRASGFAMDGYFVWCGSVIKADNTYQLFASRWPVPTSFPDGYRTHSEIVRAVATKPEGPYIFQEVVIGPRAAGKWDSGMAHNPAIYHVDGTFVLYYIGSDVGSRYRQIGVATATAIAGPWTRRDQPRRPQSRHRRLAGPHGVTSIRRMNVLHRGRTRPMRTVSFDARRNAVRLIEQRLLPHRFEVVATRDFRATARAIRDMVVRGAPAIAATAAYGLAQGARIFRGTGLAVFERHVDVVQRTLAGARPTAIDPVNALRQVRAAMADGRTVAERQARALAAAEAFADRSVEECRAIGQHGAGLIRDGMRILTHCNAGWLACVDIGTATAPIYAAHALGHRLHVFCDETRPRCQGASLTAWELARQGVRHQVIADNAAGHLMQRGEIDLVIVGSDRVLGRTGEVANKIGTYTKAVLAHRHRIPFYVAVPFSTIDWTLHAARDIPIEERDAAEVLGAWGVPDGGRAQRYVRIANPSSGARNPAFDVTPAELVTGIITPAGLYRPRELWARRRALGWR